MSAQIKSFLQRQESLSQKYPFHYYGKPNITANYVESFFPLIENKLSSSSYKHTKAPTKPFLETFFALKIRSENIMAKANTERKFSTKLG